MTNNAHQILAAVTATNTPEAIDMHYAKKATIIAKRSAHTSGSSVISVEGSIDGVIYAPLNLMELLVNTNAQTLTRVASKSLGGNATTVLAIDIDTHPVRWIKITMTRVTDGTNDLSLLLQEECE